MHDEVEKPVDGAGPAAGNELTQLLVDLRARAGKWSLRKVQTQMNVSSGRLPSPGYLSEVFRGVKVPKRWAGEWVSGASACLQPTGPGTWRVFDYLVDRAGDTGWEKPAAPDRLTPARVRRGFRNFRANSALPADAPKPSRPGPRAPARITQPQTGTPPRLRETAKRDMSITARIQHTG